MMPAQCTASQSAAAVLMVRPAHFAANAETQASNRFQRQPAVPGRQNVEAAAVREADALADALCRRGIDVQCFDGQPHRRLPDEVFPNNWISLHADGTIVLYPLMAANRRQERRTDVVETLQRRFDAGRLVDLSGHEAQAQFLEGTGSLVLDHVEGVAYAALSARTHAAVLDDWAARLGYEPVSFRTADPGGLPIYHTNVLMSVGTRFAALGATVITLAKERERVVERLQRGGRELIALAWSELEAFAGNLLELRGRDGPVIVLSARALAALRRQTRGRLERHGELLAVDVGTIEAFGGGSVRCMLAEIFPAPR